MAVTLLGCLYNDVLNGKPNSITTFVDGVKAISVFYILWRACDSNSGIDNYYRNYFKGKDDDVNPHHWLKEKGSIDLADLKKYLKTSLFADKGIVIKQDWLAKAKSYLKYDSSSSVCRIAILIAAHDTIVDDANAGLMKLGKNNSSQFLKLNNWTSDDFRDIEHIAPQESDGSWDTGLYDLNSKLFDTIGNLTLLPSEINISASNKGWKTKFLYYQHLGIKDLQKMRELAAKAATEGILLNQSTVELLQNSNHNEHIVPILSVGENGKWDAELVSKRSERMLELMWDKVIKWLE